MHEQSKTGVTFNYNIVTLSLRIGEYHQYDTIAYPKKTTVSKTFQENVQGFFKTVGSAIINVFSSNKQSKQESPEEVEFTPLGAREMSIYCLDAYLQPLKEMLCSGKLPEKFDIHERVAEVYNIFKSLQVQRIHQGNAEKKEVELSKMKEVSG